MKTTLEHKFLVTLRSKTELGKQFPRLMEKPDLSKPRINYMGLNIEEDDYYIMTVF